METRKLPVGISDFNDVITGNYYYVDKTLFIKEIIDRGDKILLVPRPRRFGKTLNLSMLKYFYDCCPQWPPVPGTRSPAKVENAGAGTGPLNSYKRLFGSLAIRKAGQEYLDKMGKHPVIFLSFREIKELEWETCLDKIQGLIQDEYLKHKYLLDSPELEPQEKDYFKKEKQVKAIMKKAWESCLFSYTGITENGPLS